MKPIAKRLIPALVLTVIAGAASAYAWHWYRDGRFIESTDDAYERADVVDVRPEISGRIRQVLVRDNQVVHAGDVLVRLSRDTLEARLAKARAERNQAKAAMEDAHERTRLQATRT